VTFPALTRSGGANTLKPMSVSAPRFVKCVCQYCNRHVEFDATHAGEVVACPHCGLETLLYVPQAPLPGPPETKRPSPPCSEPTRPTATETPPREQLAGLYYYKIKDATKGPYTLEQLRGLWMNGQITADALYRGNDSSQWLPLRESPVLSAGKTGGQISPPIPPLRTVHSLARNGMNRIQKQVLAGGAAVMLLMGLFPPWTAVYPSFERPHAMIEKRTGYYFLFHPPKLAIEGSVKIGFNLLLVQWAMVAFVLVAALPYLKDRDKK
jgi:DNA-directed RNA polymerase subunit RPC12/RpoP